MAVDTFAKRLSIIALATRRLMTLPDPDGTIAAGDRLHFLRLYSGILAEVASGTVPTGIMPPSAAIPTRSPQVFLVIEDVD